LGTRKVSPKAWSQSDVARDLDVLLLILPDGHLVDVVQQDVGGHQRRVCEHAAVGRLTAVERRLVGMAALELARRQAAHQHPT
jgi:hypothetical protein